MARKSKIALHRSDDLEAVDAELDVAMSDLDATNERVADLLGHMPHMPYAPEEPEPAGPDRAAPQPERSQADSQDAGDPDAKGHSPSGHEGAKQAE